MLVLTVYYNCTKDWTKDQKKVNICDYPLYDYPFPYKYDYPNI